MSLIQTPVSFGELLDKIAILQIKSERMSDAAKLANVRNELSCSTRPGPTRGLAHRHRRAARRPEGGERAPVG